MEIVVTQAFSPLFPSAFVNTKLIDTLMPGQKEFKQILWRFWDKELCVKSILYLKIASTSQLKGGVDDNYKHWVKNRNREVNLIIFIEGVTDY